MSEGLGPPQNRQSTRQDISLRVLYPDEHHFMNDLSYSVSEALELALN
jgi:hypothetical protein